MQITNLLPIARAQGVPRYVEGVALEHVVGDPMLGPAEERRLRRRIVERALEALTAEAIGSKRAAVAV